MNEQTFGDMSEVFDFEEEGTDFLDGPLSGWVRRKTDGAWFAYDCQPIIAGKLWHWTLVSAPNKEPDIQQVLIEAARTKLGSWLSITEDRRSSPTSMCHLVEMANSAAVPVLASVSDLTPEVDPAIPT
ncbi:MAG: hypothetical protein KF764_25570 [Labilithrix sp.]|nr:hypothetical protein [Labilithrix sp.]